MSTSILVVSDIHGGSPVSLMKERVLVGDAERKAQNVILSNESQDELRKEWDEMLGKYDKIDKVLCLGDSCDGTNVLGRGYDLLTSNMYDQVSIAVDMLEDINCNQFTMVQGSPYHTQLNMSADKAVMIELANRKPIKYKFSGSVMEQIEGVKISLRHVTGYRQNYLDRPAGLLKEIRAIVGHPYYKDESRRPDLLLRAHTHYYTEVDAYNIRGICCPVWKCTDDYASRTTGSLVPADCGYVYIEVDGNDYNYEIHSFNVPI